MATVGSSIAKTQTSFTDSNTTITIFNIALGAVNTEQSQALPADTKKFLMKTRGKAELKLSHTATESGTKYITIPGAAVYEDINFYSAETLYFQSPQTSDTVEIIAYV